MKTVMLIFFVAMVIFAPSVSYSQAMGHSSSIPLDSNHNSVPPVTPTKQGLTDQDKITSETYVHTGYVNREYDKLCAGKEKECEGQDVSQNPMLSAAAKAYSMIVGMAGDKLPLKPKSEPKVEAKAEGEGRSIGPDDEAVTDTKPEAGAADAKPDAATGAKPDAAGPEGKDVAGKDKEQTRPDYCRYVAMAGETVAGAQQQMEQKQIQETPVNAAEAQREGLYQAARGHEARANSAKVQTYTFGATTACYAGMVATGVQPTPGVLLKLGGAAVLTMFFKKEMDRNQAAADKVKEIAAKMPGAGVCNPITQKNCYCAQPETKYDPAYCLPQPIATQAAKKPNTVGGDVLPITCLDNKMQADPQCKCREHDSCYDQAFSDISGPSFAGRTPQMMVAPLKNLTNGGLLGGKGISGASTLARQAVQTANDVGNKLPPAKGLNKNQEKEAQALESLGVHPNLARNLALQSPSGGTMANFSRGLGGGSWSPGGTKTEKADYMPGQNPNVSYHGTGGGAPGKAKNDTSFLSQFGKKGPEMPNSKVVELSNKAQEAAEINGAGDKRNIFEIVTYRYHVSGWKQLELSTDDLTGSGQQ